MSEDLNKLKAHFLERAMSESVEKVEYARLVIQIDEIQEGRRRQDEFDKQYPPSSRVGGTTTGIAHSAPKKSPSKLKKGDKKK